VAKVRGRPPCATAPASEGRLAPGHARRDIGRFNRRAGCPGAGAAAQRHLQLADRQDAAFGDAVGGTLRRDVLALRQFEDAGEVVVDAADQAHCAFAVVTVDLQRHVHHATGVDCIVRRIQDAARMQLVADFQARQLVVGGAADDLRLDPRQRVGVDRTFQRARCEHVGVHLVDLIRLDCFGAEIADRAINQRAVQVGDVQLGTAVAQQLHQFHADVAQALHGDAGLAHFLMAELEAHRRHQCLQRTVGGERGGIAGATMDLVHAGHELAFQVDVLHVVDVGSDVLGGDVAPAQRIDIAAEGTEQHLGLVHFGVADDHRLAATHVEAGQCILVGHRPAQPQRIGQRLVGAGVGAHAHAAQGRAEGGVVDGDDRLQAGVVVVAEHHLFVAGGGEGFE